MVGIDTRKLNSSAAGRLIPTICPPVIVDMDREVPGKTAEQIWQSPIQMACPSDICSTSGVAGSERELHASTTHMTTPPIRSDQAITRRLSRFLPMVLVSSQAGMAVKTKAISVNEMGCV